MRSSFCGFIGLVPRMVLSGVRAHSSFGVYQGSCKLDDSLDVSVVSLEFDDWCNQ